MTLDTIDMGQGPMLRGDLMLPEAQEEALAAFIHRYTGNHKPRWADGTRYRPQFKDDMDWLANAWFHVTKGGRLSRRHKACHSRPTWPEGA